MKSSLRSTIVDTHCRIPFAHNANIYFHSYFIKNLYGHTREVINNMIIKTLTVKNFRSVLDGSIDCDSLTALVGRNGTGKSAYLRALEVFYEPKAAVAPEDYYADDTSAEVEIAVTFTDLGTEEKTLFAPYLDGSDLTIARVFSPSMKKPGTYHGMRLRNPDFEVVRTAGSKSEIRKQYADLKATPKYTSLPDVRSADAAEEELVKWEDANPSLCKRMRDDGQFFGFTEVGQGYLGRFTRFIRVPAVRDAAEDASEGKGSCVTEIMDLVVRNTIATRKEFLELKDEAQQKYTEIMDPDKLTELGELETQLSTTLKNFAPQANVSLEWAPLGNIDIPMPKANVRLHEDGYKSTVQRTGHGLQRAFILTMLQHLAAAKGKGDTSVEDSTAEGSNEQSGASQLPGLVLAIEEPELYQHPSRQRHMAAILFKLAHGAIPGVAKRTQVLYSTHSPLFVDLDRFDQIRLLRKVVSEKGKPKVTNALQGDLSAVAEELWKANRRHGEPFTEETLRSRLQAIMTPMVNEGFFSDVVVLVEGDQDRAAILGTAASMNRDFDSEGIAVIPCNGKNCLDRPLLIFRSLDIPVYVVWDGDHGKNDAKPEDNHRLLRLLGQTEEDWPCAVQATYACFEKELEDALTDDIGNELFSQLLKAEQTRLDIRGKKDALKKPIVIQHIVKEAAAQGRKSETLSSIVDSILALIPKQES